ncbi:CoA transferase [Sinomonas sp. ASV322]|uniref:CaiB/BaiF CoA transferase family protein n=1 Tax=Sinomonas sp. ASV322 TaxID=3041920 RepID=UPI0027DB19D6|nr:CoA transferase [Sinomonas sp. ASV322]MDQ4501552.1 CoA transferase [Sinomonas sp. ASV322]
MTATPTRGTGPLEGTLVVDLSRALAGPHAGMMLGDLGARVIKVENPNGGDDTRGWGPPFVDPADGTLEGHEGRESTYFLSCNRNKESITLDLKDEADKDVLRELVRRADVLVENFRPGTLDRLGFDPQTLEELNPRLVILSISGFGHDGPEGQRAGYDQIAQGEAGLMSLTGSGPDDPQRVGVPIGDLLAGIHGAYGVLAALLERERTGRGQVVRTSLLSSIVSVLAFQGTRWTVGGEVPQAQGNHHPSIAPYGLFRCAGGAVQIAVGSEGLWARFSGAFGLDAEDPRWADNATRVQHRAELIEAVEAAFTAFGPDELLAKLDEAGVPAGRVRSLDEVFAWEQTRSQHLALELEHSSLGRIEVPGGPLRFFRPDGTETTRLDHAAPPRLGEHDESVRAWLGGVLAGAEPR